MPRFVRWLVNHRFVQSFSVVVVIISSYIILVSKDIGDVYGSAVVIVILVSFCIFIVRYMR